MMNEKRFDSKKKEVKTMKKGLVILMAVAMLFAMTGLALAVQDNTNGTGSYTTSGYTTKGNITANQYDLNATVWNDGNGHTFTFAKAAKNWDYKEQGKAIKDGLGNTITYTGYDSGGGQTLSTHVYGTWNSPYTYGVDGYNYNDAQDYTDTGAQVGTGTHVYYPVNGAFSQAFQNMGMPLVTIPAGQPYAGELGVETTLTASFTSGPHGGYLTSTHRCRECHAVHRAAGKFKLLRSDTRFEACDWCHGTGAGSGFNIQMDNDDNYTTEYNVGHTMGFGIQSGKWKAPDDTYPAFTPNYWMGGFSCFDCHSPHANPARIMGYDQNAKPIESVIKLETGEVYNIGNPGHDNFTDGGDGFADAAAWNGTYWIPTLGGPLPGKSKPYYLAGSWLLIKNPDREIAQTTETVDGIKIYTQKAINTAETDTVVDGKYIGGRDSGMYWGPLVADTTTPFQVNPGQEITDNIYQALNEFSTNTAYPVNKQPTDWNNPIASAGILEDTTLFNFAAPNKDYGYNVRNPFCRSNMLSEFCADCHDGNAGFHTTQAPLFSEDRALRNQTVTSNSAATDTVTGDSTNFKGQYDLGYGHDTQPRHCGRRMKFNPEDDTMAGPHCRNCHKGSSGCGACHNSNPAMDIYVNTTTASSGDINADAAENGRAAITWLFAAMIDMAASADPAGIGPMLPMLGYTTGTAGSYEPVTMYKTDQTSDGQINEVEMSLLDTPTVGGPKYTKILKNSRTVEWSTAWRSSTVPITATCSDDGFSWPHRTLGWKMLKDDLFGIDIGGDSAGHPKLVSVGETRSTTFGGGKAHDVDSVCLDCHNPTVWNATSSSNHTDTTGTTIDDKNDDLLLRGLP